MVLKLEPRPWLSGGVCTPHSLDLELEDIAKLGFVEEDIAEVRRRCEVRTECELTDTSCQLAVLPSIMFFFSSQKKRAVKFLREHQYSLFLWREHAAKEVLNPGATRFATNFIMSASLITQSDAAKDMVTDRRYMSWLKGEGTKGKRKKSYYNEGVWLKSKFLDDDWWAKGELILEIVEPIVTLLRMADSELPLMGKVYHHMSVIASKLEDPSFASALTSAQRAKLVKIHADRWSYLHNYYHATGFALDPEFANEVCHTNIEVMKGFRITCDRLFYDAPEKATKAKNQFMIYKNRSQGIFLEPGTFEHAKEMPSHLWWEMYGAEIPELQHVAMKVLSKRSSACSVERLWSLFGNVWTPNRASLGVSKAIRLVKAGSNLRLEKKLLALDYELDMRSWSVNPGESDDEL